MTERTSIAQLVALYSCVWDAIETEGGRARRPVEPPADTAGAATPLFDSRFHEEPATRHLDSALAAAERTGNARIAGLVRAAANLLVWSRNGSYEEENVGRYFLDNHATGMLTGPEGNLARQSPVSGFVLIGPGAIYPMHNHAPREVYLVLTPDAEWSHGEGGWFRVEAGQVVHHRSWQDHAIRVGRTPFLGFAAWLDEGDRGTIAVRDGRVSRE